MTKLTRVLGLQILAMLAWIPGSALASNVVLIDVPGATSTTPWDINSQGDVVGYFSTGDGHSHGFLWSKGAFIYIDVPGATSTGLFGVNDGGDIVGMYSPPFPGLPQGFLLQDGEFTPLGELLFPWGINNRGDIVGADFRRFRVGFLLDAAGVLTSFDLFDSTVKDINNAGVMVGVCCFGTNRFGQGFSIDKRGTITFIDAPGVQELNANGITERGDIVGWAEMISPSFQVVRRGFVLDHKGAFRFVDIPGALSTSVLGVNDRGDLVGTYFDGTSGHAFVLREQKNLSALKK